MNEEMGVHRTHLTIFLHLETAGDTTPTSVGLAVVTVGSAAQGEARVHLGSRNAPSSLGLGESGTGDGGKPRINFFIYAPPRPGALKMPSQHDLLLSPYLRET